MKAVSPKFIPSKSGYYHLTTPSGWTELVYVYEWKDSLCYHLQGWNFPRRVSGKAGIWRESTLT